MSLAFGGKLALSVALGSLAVVGAWAADFAPAHDGLLSAGLFGLAIGAQDADAFDPSEPPDIVTGTDLTLAAYGAFNIPVAEMISFQVDGHSEFYDRSSSMDDAKGAHMFGGHLSYRDPGQGLLGIFAGAGIGDSYESFDGLDGDEGGLGILGGIEGQAYLGNITLYGQLGLADFVTDEDGGDPEGFVDGWFAAAEARYFVHEDFMLHANFSYGETDQYEDGDVPGEIWNWGAGGKLRLTDSMPLYGTADYRGGYYYSDQSAPDEVTEHAFLVGVTMLFGASNLMENDRRGATLSTPMLPSRAAAWDAAID